MKTSDNMPNNTKSASNRKKNTIVLIFLFLAFVFPAILATWLYHSKVQLSAGTTNLGKLLQPVWEMPALVDTDTTQLAPNHWLLFTFADAACDTNCEDNLYKMRQVRLALADNRDRVERLLVVSNISSEELSAIRQRIDEEYPRTLLAQATEIQPYKNDYLYIRDPLGNVMLEYSPEDDPRDILADLDALLKNSRIG